MTLLKIALLSLIATVSVHAHAQREPVPVVDFVNVPVPPGSEATTGDRVKVAFLKAGANQHWDITPVGEGQLEARFVKEFKHTVVATIQYSATSYSVAYKSSDNMKFQPGPNALDQTTVRRPSVAAVAAIATQNKLFVNDPFTPYAVARKEGVLHPFYEVWVRRLLAGANGELKAL